MSSWERQLKILEFLCIVRHETCSNLAFRFGVSDATDIAVLMCRFPVETSRGRYRGGVWVADGYYLYRNAGHNELDTEQTAVLRRMMLLADEHDRSVISGILVQFAPRPIVP
ncbi:hypothetical protein D3Z48_18090 [Clostridiaceae bacterium]|nr:hypothetical protein [Clostridiaceae bacterium]